MKSREMRDGSATPTSSNRPESATQVRNVLDLRDGAGADDANAKSGHGLCYAQGHVRGGRSPIVASSRAISASTAFRSSPPDMIEMTSSREISDLA